MKYIKLIKITGLILLGYILFHLDYKIIVNIFREINYIYLIPYSLLFFTFISLKAFRWQQIQNSFSQNNKQSFLQSLYVTLDTLYLGFVTPGRAGDFLRVWLLKDLFNIPKKESIIAFFYDRFQDLFYMSAIAFIGTFFIFYDSTLQLTITLILIVMIVIFKYKIKIINFVLSKTQYSSSIETNKRFELNLIAINLLVYFLYFWQLYFVALALNIELQWHIIGMIAAISGIIALIPISVMGLGLRESSFIYLLGLYSISQEQAVVFSLAYYVIFYIILVALLYVFNKQYIKKLVL